MGLFVAVLPSPLVLSEKARLIGAGSQRVLAALKAG